MGWQAIGQIIVVALWAFMAGCHFAEWLKKRHPTQEQRRGEWLGKQMDRAEFHAKVIGDELIFTSFAEIKREGRPPIYVTVSDKPIEAHLNFASATKDQ